MKLIGMLDSPYVRRVAISLCHLRLSFDHDALSAFGGYEDFSKINPVVKAPTLITDDGVVLMDSSLIIDYAEHLTGDGFSLSPVDRGQYARAQRIVGLALAACEKTVQIVYEHNLRPAEKWHQPWLDRVGRQLQAAYEELEHEIISTSAILVNGDAVQAAITSSVAFRFTREKLPDVVSGRSYPALSALSEFFEGTPEFMAYPYS